MINFIDHDDANGNITKQEVQSCGGWVIIHAKETENADNYILYAQQNEHLIPN